MGEFEVALDQSTTVTVASGTTAAITESTDGTFEIANASPAETPPIVIEIQDLGSEEPTVVSMPSDTTVMVSEDNEGQLQVENAPESQGTIVVEFDGVETELESGEMVETSDDLCVPSDLSPTVVINTCDSGVVNPVLANGCTITDLIAECAADAPHSEAVCEVCKEVDEGAEEGRRHYG